MLSLGKGTLSLDEELEAAGKDPGIPLGDETVEGAGGDTGAPSRAPVPENALCGGGT